MVATFIIDWPVLAFFGFLFGRHAPDEQPLRSRAFFGGLLATAGFTASALLSYAHAPDWMWMYYRDPDEMESTVKWMGPGYVAAFVVSFLGAVGLRRSGGPALRAATAASLAAEVAVVAATWDRYHRIGTKQEWENGTADELLTLKPEGRAKQVSSYGPMVAIALLGGLILARTGRAPTPGR